MPAIHHNHPEAEERDLLDIPARSTRPANMPAEASSPEGSVKDRLVSWKAANPDVSNAQIARMIGYSAAYVSHFLTKSSKDFPGDLVKFERAVIDFLRGRALKTNFDFPAIETEVTTATASFADYVRSVGGIGVLHGDAGLGKSIALALLAQNTKTGILIVANSIQRDAKGIKSLLWPHCSNGYKANTNRWAHIVAVLRGTNRLIMVDSAQRLDNEGRNMLCDLLDETGCPILLAGNPDIMRRLRSNDQQSSRALPALGVALKDPEPVVSHILRNLIPEHADALMDDALKLATRKGHLRQLVNTIKATLSLAKTPGFKGKSIRSAWASARSLSVDLAA